MNNKKYYITKNDIINEQKKQLAEYNNILKEYNKIKDEQEKEKQIKWHAEIPQAMEILTKTLQKAYKNNYQNIKLIHIDAAGFWFTYELKNNKQPQNYCVYHSDLEGGKKCNN